MPDPDYEQELLSALNKAHSSNDAGVRIAYFELANFYHRKIQCVGKADPAADLLKELACDCCSEDHCWCKTSEPAE